MCPYPPYKMEEGCQVASCDSIYTFSLVVSKEALSIIHWGEKDDKPIKSAKLYTCFLKNNLYNFFMGGIKMVT
jgi:hypothetical protein